MMEYLLRKQMWYVNNITILYMYYNIQWSYGVLCWEVFSGGRIPYPGLDPSSVIELLDNGSRLTIPSNKACSDEM